MMAVFFFIAHERVLNFMRNPKLAHILVLYATLRFRVVPVIIISHMMSMPTF